MCQRLQIPFLWHSNKSTAPRGCDCPGCNCSCYIHSAPFGALALLVGMHFYGHHKGSALCCFQGLLPSCSTILRWLDQERSVRCWYWVGPKQTRYIKSIPSSNTMLFRLSQCNYCCLSLKKRRYAIFFKLSLIFLKVFKFLLIFFLFISSYFFILMKSDLYWF